MISGIPEGFTLDRIGYPMDGDYFIAHTDVIYQWPDCPDTIQHPVGIVSPTKSWKILRAIAWDGQPTKARFRTKANEPWTYGVLVEYRPGTTKFKSADGHWYRVCEVLRK
jgi:hypothetical protein